VCTVGSVAEDNSLGLMILLSTNLKHLVGMNIGDVSILEGELLAWECLGATISNFSSSLFKRVAGMSNKLDCSCPLVEVEFLRVVTIWSLDD